MTGRVYFLECAGRIKIGYSHDVEDRRKELATGAPEPLKLLAQVPGTRRDESAIHRHLAVHRQHGEWFADCRAVRDAIDLIASRGASAIDRDKPKTPHELRVALRRIAEPSTRYETVKEVIGRASSRAGLPYWRTSDIWYGKARRVERHEALKIRDALIERVGNE